MKLSERIKDYRIDRPDEWTMDSLAGYAISLEESNENLLDALKSLYENCEAAGRYLDKANKAIKEAGIL